MHFKHKAGVLSVCALLSACGTIFNGSSQKVSFDSNVKNVRIYENGNYLCTTPCTEKIAHGSDTYYLTAKKDGYEDVTLRLVPSASGWFWMNIITGGLLGSTTDYASGGMWTYDRDSFFVEMEKAGRKDVSANRSQIRKYVLKNYAEIRKEIASGDKDGDYLTELALLTDMSVQEVSALGESASNGIEFTRLLLDDGEEPAASADESDAPAPKKQYPAWVAMFESEGYIGQTDNNFINYIGYGEAPDVARAKALAVEDAYNKAMAPITGVADGSRKVPLRNLNLSSEYKSREKHKVKVWLLYRYPKAQLSEDIAKYSKK